MSEVTFDSGPLLPDDDLVTIAAGDQAGFKGGFITVHGHPVYIGDKKGGEAGGHAGGSTDSPSADTEEEESPEERQDRLEVAADEYSGYDSSNKYTDTLTSSEIGAIIGYSHHGDKVINGDLRGVAYDYPESGETAEYLASIPALDSAVSKAKTPAEMVVYRGVQGPMFAKAKVGSKFRDKGFLSTSSDIEVAEGFAQSRVGAILRFELPAGYEGAAPISSISQYDFEKEILIKRDTEWEIAEVKKHARVGTLNILLRPAPPKASKGKKPKAGEATHSADKPKRPRPYERFAYTDPNEIEWTEGGPEEAAE